MSEMTSWAERECRIACKRENPDYNFDSADFDYGCSCYKSALKAYRSLMEDEHSGFSFGVTKNILIRLMEGLPLTPITDEDFFSVEYGTEEHPLASEEWLRENHLLDERQCPRMSSLFRREHEDRTVTYHDVDRAYYINVEDPSDTYSSSTDFLDEMFPVTMPYYPKPGKYRIYAQTFLTDEKHGDFDTRGILYLITPEGKKVEVNRYSTEGDDGKWKEITREEYDELLARRIDRLNAKIADILMWTLISNSGKDVMEKEKAYREVPKDIRDKWMEELTGLCTFFEDEEHYRYNTFTCRQALCTGDETVYGDVPELVTIAGYLKSVKDTVMHVVQHLMKPDNKNTK